VKGDGKVDGYFGRVEVVRKDESNLQALHNSGQKKIQSLKKYIQNIKS